MPGYGPRGGYGTKYSGKRPYKARTKPKTFAKRVKQIVLSTQETKMSLLGTDTVAVVSKPYQVYGRNIYNNCFQTLFQNLESTVIGAGDNARIGDQVECLGIKIRLRLEVPMATGQAVSANTIRRPDMNWKFYLIRHQSGDLPDANWFMPGLGGGGASPEHLLLTDIDPHRARVLKTWTFKPDYQPIDYYWNGTTAVASPMSNQVFHMEKYFKLPRKISYDPEGGNVNKRTDVTSLYCVADTPTNMNGPTANTDVIALVDGTATMYYKDS